MPSVFSYHILLVVNLALLCMKLNGLERKKDLELSDGLDPWKDLELSDGLNPWKDLNPWNDQRQYQLEKSIVVKTVTRVRKRC